MRDYLRDVSKETLTLENIKHDLKKLYSGSISGFFVCLFFAAISIFAGVAFFDKVKFGTCVCAFFAALFLVPAVICLINPLIGRKVIGKEINIVSDRLVDIKVKSEFVPKTYGVGRRGYYEFCFAKSGKYDLYVDVCGDNNYKWSNTYVMSNQGIYNYSRIEDEFYLVLSNGKKPKILLLYNKKLFELKED